MVISFSASCGAHPRACGENPQRNVAATCEGGSSPRVRGKPGINAKIQDSERLIPARAGKTSCSRRARASRPAHPRACGENSTAPSRPAAPVGSSPRVRGKPFLKDDADLESRLIPARAGKTRHGGDRHRQHRAHPRACGENGRPEDVLPRRSGSSPRVRGKPPHPLAQSNPGGLIPARAGKTTRASIIHPPKRAHPRACGENSGVGSLREVDEGSSPRVRGKRLPGLAALLQERLIPARAGKTRCGLPDDAVGAAHPRACGENGEGV